MKSELPSVAEVRRDHDDRRRNPKYTQDWYDNYQQGIIDRREAKKAETARRNLLKRTAKAKGILPSFRKMLERPGFGICTACLTEKPEAEMQRRTLCRFCHREYHRQRDILRRGPPRTKLTDEELAANLRTRQINRGKAKSKSGWSGVEFRAYQVATTALLALAKNHFFQKPPKGYRTRNGKVFDTEFERDEYVRGWREYKEWCIENRDAIRRVAKDRANELKLLKKATTAGFSTIEEYQQWIASKPHPRKKSEEHHVEKNRIRDQWRNYRKRVKAGMSANGGRIPYGWFNDQLHHQKHCCVICTTPFDDGDVEIDHIVPVSRGGPNVAWNLQLVCSTCNQSKADKMPWEFKAAA